MAECNRTYRDAVVVQDAVLVWHKSEVDEMSSRPQNIVCNNSLDKLVLHERGTSVRARLVTASPRLMNKAMQEPGSSPGL